MSPSLVTRTVLRPAFFAYLASIAVTPSWSHAVITCQPVREVLETERFTRREYVDLMRLPSLAESPNHIAGESMGAGFAVLSSKNGELTAFNYPLREREVLALAPSMENVAQRDGSRFLVVRVARTPRSDLLRMDKIQLRRSADNTVELDVVARVANTPSLTGAADAVVLDTHSSFGLRCRADSRETTDTQMSEIRRQR
jgi:hypothetical protein